MSEKKIGIIGGLEPNSNIATMINYLVASGANTSILGAGGHGFQRIRTVTTNVPKQYGLPHYGGAKERARRQRQIERGIIKATK